MEAQLLLASALTPSLLLIWLFYSRDHHPEPRGVVLATFLLGVVIALPVLLLAFPLDLLANEIREPHLRGIYRAFFVAAIPEELLKLLVVWRYCARHKAFDEPMDGLVYGAIASLGFATLENILYVVEGGLGLALMRAFTAVPSHAFWGALMGFYVGQAKFGPPSRRARNLCLAYLVPVLLHGLYDAPVLAFDQATELAASTAAEVPELTVSILFLSLAVVIVSGTWAFRAAAELRRAQLTAPPPPAAATAATTSWVGIIFLIFGGLLVGLGGFFLLGLCAALTHPGLQQAGGIFATTVSITLLPLVLGLFIFRAGLRRL